MPHASETGHGSAFIFVGLDVHKDTISVALAEEGRIVNTPKGPKKLLDKLEGTAT